MEPYGDEWGRKGATLGDKTARSEFGLTQDEIIAAIRAGKLQYRPAAMHGNPWLRLLRREVEDLVSTRRGDRYLRERQARTELAAGQPRAETAPGPAHGTRGKAGCAPFRTRRARLMTSPRSPQDRDRPGLLAGTSRTRNTGPGVQFALDDLARRPLGEVPVRPNGPGCESPRKAPAISRLRSPPGNGRTSPSGALGERALVG